MAHRRSMALLIVVLLAVVPVGLGAAPAAASPPSSRSGQVALDWQRIALRTVFTDGKAPVQSGPLFLGFTSLAVRDAVSRAERQRHASPAAAAAVAAHDVLVEYFPAFAPRLDSDLANTLAGISDGRAKANGVKIGERAAARMIRSRQHDGRDDTSIVYNRPAAPGVWQPSPAPMVLPWLGFVDFLVIHQPVELDGPDAITSAEYAADFDEVKRLGSAEESDRTPEQDLASQFFNANPSLMYRNALLAHLDTAGLSLSRTTQLFAALDAATADSAIQCWRAKYDYGYWRPSAAIVGADTDGNDLTSADSAWTPYLPTPPYPEYPSGHACFTAPFLGVVQAFLGDDVPLTLQSPTGPDRYYPTVSSIEQDTLPVRIWQGIHFRDAMEDGYYLGYETAAQVLCRA